MKYLKSYTISGIKALYNLPRLDLAQFTLNSRTWPGRRQTVKALKEVSKCTTTGIYIHWDFIYIASRYAMFSSSTREAIVKELVDIMEYSKSDKNIRGIVMHTDFSLRKDILKCVSADKIRDSYSSSTWDTNNVIALSEDIARFTENNIGSFYEDVKKCWKGEEFPIKVYLENTTKISPDGQGRFDYLHRMVVNNGWSDLFGLCFDTEHYFAVDGNYSLFETLDSVRDSKVDIIVHLNTIPKEVLPKSGKDRHSETTIFECSIKPSNWYINMMKELTTRRYPYIREVHEDTMYRELAQIEDYEHSGSNKSGL